MFSRTITTSFQEVTRRTEVPMVCSVCKKKRKRVIKTTHTVNPWKTLCRRKH